MANRDELLHDVLCGNRVDCWNCETRDWLRGINLFRYIRCCQLVPFLELCVLKVDVVIEHSLCRREPGSLELLLPPVGEFLPVLATVF